MGLRDRARVPGQAGLGRRVRARGGRAARPGVARPGRSRRSTRRCARSSTRSSSRCATRGCGPPTSAPSSAARATGSSSWRCSTRSWADRRGRRSSSAARHPTPATPRSSPTTAPTSRRSATCARCSTARCSRRYSMTEPHAGADPTMFTTRAVQDGDEWVINGWKFFSSNARTASFLIVMAVTNPDVSAYKGMSMFLVPTDTPGREHRAQRRPGRRARRARASHALIHYEDVRVPAEALLGGEGQAFAIAQTRLGGGRIHHAMRTIGMAQKALDMMCERALSRETAGQRAGRQAVRAGLHRRLLRPARAVPAVRAVHGVVDRQAQRLPQGAQGHRHGQGGHADRAARHRVALHAGPRRARA